ncbi:unnamed protein product, partial [Iphiclides podalirius]
MSDAVYHFPEIRETCLDCDTPSTDGEHENRNGREIRNVRSHDAVAAHASESNPRPTNPLAAFLETIIKKGANFVLSANFAFWIID